MNFWTTASPLADGQPCVGVVEEPRAAVEPTLLEWAFPFREISLLNEADRRYRDPSYGIHRWWARRPPALVRGVLLAAFETPTTLGRFWSKFADGSDALRGTRIHDPFLGGGSTVVEASRLSALASGTDVDPLACLIARHELNSADSDEVGTFGKQLADHVLAEVGHLYSGKPDGWTPLHWFWISVVECPGCETRTPLYRNLLIARDAKKIGAVVRDSAQTVFCPECFKIHHLRTKNAKKFECCGPRRVDESTFSDLKFRCPNCSRASDHTELKTIKAQTRLLAVEETHPEYRRRIRAPNDSDRERVRESETFVTLNASRMLIPDCKFTSPRRDSRPISYGAERPVDLFHARQLATFGIAFKWIEDTDATPRVKEALKLATSHALAFNNRLCGYAADYGRLSALFSIRSYSLPALSVELNPLHPSAGRGTLLKLLRERVSENRRLVRRTVWDPTARRRKQRDFAFVGSPNVDILCLSALTPYPTGGQFDFSFFDPPYFDYISYSELSEFYRAWLELAEIGGAPLLPSSLDPVGSFSTSFAAALVALRGKLRPGAPFAFTFHSTSSDAWRAVADAIKGSDHRITALWPVLADPHMGHHGANGACEWDLVIVCRPGNVCSLGRAPSLARWRKQLSPLRLGPTDILAIRTALDAFKGLFGCVGE